MFENYAVAITAKGAAVVYHWSEWREETSHARFRVFPSLEKAAADPDLRVAALSAIEKVGIPVEELDI